MNNIAGKPYWGLMTSIQHQYPYLTKNKSADIVIIGGGLIGSLCAQYFSTKGYTCILLEKGLLGRGTTSANAGVSSLFKEKGISQFYNRMGKRDTEYMIQRQKESKNVVLDWIRDEKEYCQMKECDMLNINTNAKEKNDMDKEFLFAKHLGINVNYLHNENMPDGYFVDEKKYAIVESEVLTYNPVALTYILARKSIQNCVEIYENTKVVKIEPKKQGGIVHTQYGYKINADNIIITTKEIDTFIDPLQRPIRKYAVSMSNTKSIDISQSDFVVRNLSLPGHIVRNLKNDVLAFGFSVDVGLGHILRARNEEKLQNKSFSSVYYDQIFEYIKTHYMANAENGEMKFCCNYSSNYQKTGMPFLGEIENYKGIFNCISNDDDKLLWGYLGAEIIENSIATKRDVLKNIFIST